MLILQLVLILRKKCLLISLNNCRYSAFITRFYFNISSFLIDNKIYKKDNLLNIVNEKIINLTNNVNYNNLKDIITFFQNNNLDSRKKIRINK